MTCRRFGHNKAATSCSVEQALFRVCFVYVLPWLDRGQDVIWFTEEHTIKLVQIFEVTNSSLRNAHEKYLIIHLGKRKYIYQMSNKFRYA